MQLVKSARDLAQHHLNWLPRPVPAQCTHSQKNKNVEISHHICAFLRLQKLFWKLKAATVSKSAVCLLFYADKLVASTQSGGLKEKPWK